MRIDRADGDGIVNLDLAVEIEICEDALKEKASVLATFIVPWGTGFTDGSFEQIPHQATLFTGNKSQCEEFLAWLKRELGVKKFVPAA